MKNRARAAISELEDAYQKYRCIIHDQKHMLSFIQECIENKDLNGIVYMLQIIRKSSEMKKKVLTGKDVLDKTITMKKEKWMLWI